MARGRMINQTIDYDPEFNALSVEAQMLYLRSLAFLDRDGLIIGNPRGLLAKVAPLLDHLQPYVPDIIDEWVMQGLVIRYAVKIGDILFFKGFAKNQSGMHYDRESPSRFDPPPGWTHGPKGLIPLESEPAPAPVEHSHPTESSENPAELRQESGATPAEVGKESAPIEVKVKDQIEDQLKPIEDDEDARAREPVAQAWFDYYGEEIPENLTERMASLEAECGIEATIHGIFSSVKAKSRTFKYIAQCARNYIPPPPDQPSPTSYTNGYHVDLPGVHVLTPPANPQPPPALPPPVAHDDPWAVALAEMLPTLSTQAAAWLKDSTLSEESELAGEPFYQVLVTHPKADMQWLTQQLELNVRRRLRTLIGKRINLAFVHTPTVATPTPHAAQEVTA